MIFFVVVFLIGVGLLSNSLWDLKHSDNKAAFSSKFYSGSFMIFMAFVAMVLTIEWMFN